MKLYGIFRKVKILNEDNTTFETFAIVEQEEIFDDYREAESYIELLESEGDNDIKEIREL